MAFDKANTVRRSGKSKKTGVTLKEKVLVKEYIKSNFVKKKAALKAYNVNPDNATNLATQVLNRPHVQIYLTQELTKAGLAIEDLAPLIKKTIDFNMQGKPSQAVAADMIKHALKLQGAEPASKHINVNTNLNGSVGKENITDLTSELKKLSAITQKLLAS